MKKVFTILAAAACSLSLLTAQASTVTVAKTGDNYTVTVDELTITDVPAIVQGDVNVLAINRDGVSLLVRFTDVNTLVADGTVNGSDIHYATPGAATQALEYQIPNSDFEAWDHPKASGEPDNWHGFKSAKGGFAGWAKGTLAKSDEKRPGTTGTKSAVITSGNVFGIVNNGTMTNGQLQAGNMSAASTDNHSEMSSDNTDFYTALKAAPDAISTWLKFKQNTTTAIDERDNPHANFSTIIFDGTYYQDPEDKTYTNVAAKAQNKTIKECDWTQFTIPFNYEAYESNNAATNAILITISTNADAGKGYSGDQVWVDDMTLIYNAGITDITATGLEGFSFDAATHHYDLVGEYGTITADNFTVTTDGRAAVVVKNVEDLGSGNYRITLGAYSADMMNASVYTITISKPIDNVWVLGNVNGNDWAANVGAPMTYNADNDTYTLDITTTSTSWFSFTKRLGENNDGDSWNAIAPYRFGANTEGEGTNFVMRQMYLGQELELAQDGWYNAFQVPAGEWTLTIKDLNGNRKLIIDGESWPDAQLLVQGSFNEWDNNENLIEMTLADGVYTADYTSIDCGDGYSYFKMIKRVAGEQDQMIGAVSNGDFLVTNDYLNTPLDITVDNAQAYKIPAGEFTLTADLEAMKLTIGGSLDVLGDLNSDGTVDVSDVNIAINIILGKNDNESLKALADISGDGTVDVSDVNALINIILHKN
ncbi:MAG: PCMD domain-containing protein [Muribaculaceae bacterium]|nr:PCMD domain-containing protein [Muribaculaceae bacterium]